MRLPSKYLSPFLDRQHQVIILAQSNSKFVKDFRFKSCKFHRNLGIISIEEFENAAITLQKLSQMDSFPNETQSLQTSFSKLLASSPILIPDGLIIVRGRQEN